MAQSGVGLALAVSAIALPDSVNPSLIGVATYFASQRHPRRRTAEFSAVAFLVTFAGGLLVALGLGDLILSIVPKPSDKLKYGLEIAIGVALVIAGAVLWWRRQALGSKPARDQKVGASGGSAVLVGAAVAGIELLTAFPYFAAIALIDGASVSSGAKLFLLLLYNVIYLLPVFAIVATCFVMGNRASHVIAPIGDWVNEHWPTLVAPVAAVVGAALLIYGILKLV